MSDASSDRLTHHIGLLSGRARNSADVLGRSRHYQLWYSLNALLIRFAPFLISALRFIQVRNPDSLKTDTESLPSPKKKGFSNPLLVVATTLVIFIISQIVAFVAVEAALSLLNAASSFDHSAVAQFGYIMAAEALTVGMVIGILHRAKLSLKEIGWAQRPNLKDLKWAIFGTLTFYGLLIVVTLLLSALVPSFNANQPQDVGFKNVVTTPDKLIAFISLVILPPLGEETLMRGYLYSGLRRRWHILPAMLLTSLLFGAAHLTTGVSGALWAAGVTTFVLSIVLVYLREKTGSLYASVLVHMANNFLAFFVYLHS